jgi:2-methylcitrate dehydratase PrpD
MTPSPDLSYDIADFIVNTRYERLSPAAIDGAKSSILDTLGVILAAGGMEPAVRGVVEFAQESGGRPESSVLGFGGRVPAVMAAFVNGAMAHCLDYDDQTPWGQHSASSLIPAVFAVAERVAAQRGAVSGKDMIAAVAAGQDLFNRFRCHVDWHKDWNFSTVMGVYCATAASGYLLDLSREQVANSMGIASMQSCGTAAVINAVGSDLRAMYAGFPARGAVTAALLAQKGITGVPGVFETKYGVFDMYFGNRYDRDKIVEGLGTNYTGGLTLYKRWPAVGTAHSHIHATIGLLIDNDLSVDEIDVIRIYVGDYHQLMCDPLDQRRAPSTLVDAKFSLPYLVAVAAVGRGMSLNDFTDKALKDPKVQEVARKVVPIEDRGLDWKLELPPGRVEIITRDGRKFDRIGTHVPGSPEAPMRWDDLVGKFIECARFAAVARSDEQIEAVYKAVQRLELMDDATEVLRLMA